mmetsp:Transcript_23339/g.73054  ORF Transcript_23339/g.73054 Transcript_23339/m.73054 type:complete len:210 (+) Transcript_23339:1757-2386(+)
MHTTLPSHSSLLPRARSSLKNPHGLPLLDPLLAHPAVAHRLAPEGPGNVDAAVRALCQGGVRVLPLALRLFHGGGGGGGGGPEGGLEVPHPGEGLPIVLRERKGERPARVIPLQVVEHHRQVPRRELESLDAGVVVGELAAPGGGPRLPVVGRVSHVHPVSIAAPVEDTEVLPADTDHRRLHIPSERALHRRVLAPAEAIAAPLDGTVL